MLRKFFDWLWEMVGKLPSTNARVAVSLVLILATGVKAIIIWVAPPMEWLGFLLILSGLDAAQFMGKRKSNSEYVKALNGSKK